MTLGGPIRIVRYANLKGGAGVSEYFGDTRLTTLWLQVCLRISWNLQVLTSYAENNEIKIIQTCRFRHFSRKRNFKTQIISGAGVTKEKEKKIVGSVDHLWLPTQLWSPLHIFRDF